MPVDPRDVTLYVPAHNAARTLGATLHSIAALTTRPAEVLVIADARSTDDTLAIARRAGVRVIEQHDGRLGRARNMAIEHASTPWLASCDADVVLEPAWLTALCRAADSTVAAVGGGTLEMLKTPADRWRAVNLPHNWGPRPFDNPFMLVSEMLARVDALRAIGGYRADWRYGEDSDLCQRLRQAGYRLRYEPGAVALHDRGDSVQSVLDLRWNYAYFRQRTRFESLPGLADKLAVNRTYVVQAISQTLHSRHPETIAIGLMIWLHHARRDLLEALSHWPMLDDSDRSGLAAALEATIAGATPHAWRPAIGADRVAAPNAPIADESRPPELAAAPGFQHYLRAAAHATTALFKTLGDDIRPAILDSAAYLRDPRRVPPRRPIPPRSRTAPIDRPRQPAWQSNALCEDLRRLTGLEPDLATYGPTLAGERAVPARTTVRARPVSCAAFPHLELSPSPRGDLRTALHAAEFAAIGYRTPERFRTDVPILTARDLAILLTGEGFDIIDFQTQAGFTRLIGRRVAPSGSATTETDRTHVGAAEIAHA